jgi:hypothetical protein
MLQYYRNLGRAVAQLVEALYYKALGLTQPLTEMSIRNLPGNQGRTARKADNLTAIC